MNNLDHSSTPVDLATSLVKSKSLCKLPILLSNATTQSAPRGSLKYSCPPSTAFTIALAAF